ncbi:MAG: hypothetical protein UT13_C0001G0347 [Candidatus Pacebacteria bacterium GW2011_GWF2_38_9]|nr:MAG: Uncharacterized protein US01_C0001G0355 [candidate division TM6 bacterium GW2011_GWF2_28_16]KKQ10336.1 MAG: hypothetical protein US20_C0001G0050 [Candidatus Pacebacteria bacterium GW2011_GWF1_36_5]KKQ88700.1 MAG: hypothetical protein UT13_C0001G0347 [Candidatus Pacebacteria bacterium GW2011_GWF2_38_9]HAZ73655.1 hypothetical protein [Candidatus Paceibacterota bacterium]
MKKTPAVLSLVLVALLVSIASANAAEMKGNQSVKADSSVTTTNQVKIEPTRAREELGEMKGEVVQERAEIEDDGMEVKYSSQSAKEKMGEASSKMGALLEMKDNAKGVTERVKVIAKEQIQAQEKVASNLEKMEQKKVWLKKMFGYDQEAVQSVQDEIAANSLRIEELQALKEETTSKTEIATLDEAIASLLDQNASLDNTVQEEMKNQGVFGWFRNFFNRS